MIYGELIEALGIEPCARRYTSRGVDDTCETHASYLGSVGLCLYAQQRVADTQVGMSIARNSIADALESYGGAYIKGYSEGLVKATQIAREWSP